ncbi:MAG TPA: hypothetical protein VLA89_15815, partial [Gemmatimonadales bacterium]|nr:hypothetical protein [Gemmatimonadales bacterium]
MTTKEAMPSQKALSEKQGEGYEIAAEIAKIEPVLKGAQTRRRKAEYEVERSQWILDHLTAEEEDRVPQWTEEVAKAKATLEKRQAKEDEYQSRLDELTDRRAGVIGEIKALQEKVNEERHAALAEQRERAIAVVEQAVKDHPLTAEYDLKAEVSGGGATVGWGEPHTGRDG